MASRAARRLGAFCYDHTFTRLLGTRGESETVLKDLVAAWRAARTGVSAQAATLNWRSSTVGRASSRCGRAPARRQGELPRRDAAPRRAAISAPRAALRVGGIACRRNWRTRPPCGPCTRSHSATTTFCPLAMPELERGTMRGARPSRTLRRPRSAPCTQLAAQLGRNGEHGSAGQRGARRRACIVPELCLCAAAPRARLRDLMAATPPRCAGRHLWRTLRPRTSTKCHMKRAARASRSSRHAERIDGHKQGTKEGRRQAEEKELNFVRTVEFVEGEAKGRAEVLGALGVASPAAFRAKFGVDSPPALASFFGQ
jgi:hypothetical protein